MTNATTKNSHGLVWSTFWDGLNPSHLLWQMGIEFPIGFTTLLSIWACWSQRLMLHEVSWCFSTLDGVFFIPWRAQWRRGFALVVGKAMFKRNIISPSGCHLKWFCHKIIHWSNVIQSYVDTDLQWEDCRWDQLTNCLRIVWEKGKPIFCQPQTDVDASGLVIPTNYHHLRWCRVTYLRYPARIFILQPTMMAQIWSFFLPMRPQICSTQ